jgi:Secretion system C-terminal sorting domain
MTKNYFYSIILFFCLISANSFAQDKPSKTQDATIDGLNLYPNPVSNGKVFITSKSGQDKDISIYDVLGKLILQTVLTSKELNVAALNSGVYIITIKEGEASATRKLIVR